MILQKRCNFLKNLLYCNLLSRKFCVNCAGHMYYDIIERALRVEEKRGACLADLKYLNKKLFGALLNKLKLL